MSFWPLGNRKAIWGGRVCTANTTREKRKSSNDSNLVCGIRTLSAIEIQPKKDEESRTWKLEVDLKLKGREALGRAERREKRQLKASISNKEYCLRKYHQHILQNINSNGEQCRIRDFEENKSIKSFPDPAGTGDRQVRKAWRAAWVSSPLRASPLPRCQREEGTVTLTLSASLGRASCRRFGHVLSLSTPHPPGIPAAVGRSRCHAQLTREEAESWRSKYPAKQDDAAGSREPVGPDPRTAEPEQK